MRAPRPRSSARSTSPRTSTARAASTARSCRRRRRAPAPSTRSSSSRRSSAGRRKPVLVATGPLTNVGLLFATYADARPDRIVLMGGAIGEGNRTPAAEFNIWADPEAAQRVFAEGLDTTMVGLDVTHRALIRDEHTERLRGAGRVGEVVAELVDFYARFHRIRYPDLGRLADARPGLRRPPRRPDVARGSRRPDRGRLLDRPELGADERRPPGARALRPAEREGRRRTSTATGSPSWWSSASRHSDEREGRNACAARRRRLDGAGERSQLICFAAIAPHGGPVFDQPEAPTRQGMRELARRFSVARPEAAIVLTPHGIHVDGHFAVVRSVRLEGDAAQWTSADTHYEGPGEPALADACVQALQAVGLPALGVTFGSTAAGSSTMPLDWGALIPLWFMRAPAVVVSPCRSRSNEEHVRAGRALAEATGEPPRRADRERRSRARPHGRRSVRVRAGVGRVRRRDPGGRPRQPAARARGVGSRLRRRGEGGQLLAAPDAGRGARRRIRGRAAVVRGADLLRHAHRELHAARRALAE